MHFPSKSPVYRWLSIAVVALICQVIVGCGDQRMEVYPVHGTVSLNGTPAAGADLVFYGTDEALQTVDAPIPKARADEQGRYEVSSFEPGDGAPAGEYRVTVVWRQSDSNDPENRDLARDRLQGKYADPQTSPLRVTVKPEPNNELPLEL